MNGREVRDEAERRRLRDALRGAFERAPDLQPRAGFAEGLRERLRQEPARAHGARILPGRWLALAASLLITAGLTGALLLSPVSPADALARDAIGDHQKCALKDRLLRRPVPLEDAAQRFDSALRLLLTAPPDSISTTDGTARVVERHACAYGPRRFGHVILQYRGRVVSLLMTVGDGSARGVTPELTPQLIGQPTDGLSVVSVSGTNHAVLLVSDLDSADLTRLSNAVSVPLAQRLGERRFDGGSIIAALFDSSGPGRAMTPLLPSIIRSGFPK